MDILDRLLGHDAWTTRQLLLRCRELTDEQLDRGFDIGDRSLRETLLHILENMEAWTDRMAMRPGRESSRSSGASSVEELLGRLSLAAKDQADVSRGIRDAGRLDQMYADPQEEPPNPRPLGGMIVHVITHSMHHRAQALYIMEQLGLTNLPEGDALDWEHKAFGWRNS
jgi:uncharacterized damage-inducible protein DinB